MRDETLLSGYILRVAVRRHRWHITLHNLKTGEVSAFDSFTALGEYLDLASLRISYPCRAKAPPKPS